MEEENLRSEIITIGDELLIGQVVDTNAAFIASELNNAGIDVVQITSIADRHEVIVKTLREAEKRANLILMTGGLGPTTDDITKVALCQFFKTSLVVNNDTLENIIRLFRSRGIAMTERNVKQAEIPASCIPMKNELGTAPGMWFEKNGKIFISMPGVPHEMRHMMKHYILPRLLEYPRQGAILHKTVITGGLGESSLNDHLRVWEETLPPHIKLAYLPQPGVIRLRLTARGSSRELLAKEIGEQVATLVTLIPEYIIGYDEDTLEGVVGRLLIERKMTLATAESCTGGTIAHLITSVPGSSAYYTGTVVAYSNEIKENILAVSRQSLVTYGAVSEAVVREMAQGIRERFNVDFTVATSGIAGPDGGTPEKPVGTTWIAITTPGHIVARKFQFGDNREDNIMRTTVTALNMLRLEILNYSTV
jgi:nicotinamide-nucleotide amidase